MSRFIVVKNNFVENVVISTDEDALAILSVLIPDADYIVPESDLPNAYVGCEIRNGKAVPKKPFESWIWDESEFNWLSPVEKPNDGKFYVWTEPDGWVTIPEA